MSHLSLTLLGTFAASRQGTNLTTFRSAKTQALLAYLAVERDFAHRRDTLIDLLWSEYAPKEANTNFRQSLSRLQKVIGNRDANPPFLTVTRQTVQWNSNSTYRLDVEVVLDAVAQVWVQTDLAQSTTTLQIALDHYYGDFLAGFFVADAPNFDAWVATKREYLHQQLFRAITHVADQAEELRQFAQVVDLSHRQIELSPWDEPAHRRLMRALAFQGQRTAALTQFERCIEILEEELGVGPDERTTDLAEQIRQGIYSPTSAITPLSLHPIPTAPAPRHTLNLYAILNRLDPLPAQKLFGVETALTKIETAIYADNRSWLIALDGIGGIGKTSFANALVHRLVKRMQTERGKAIDGQIEDNAETCIGYQDIGWVSAKQEEYLPDRGVQETGKAALDEERLIDLLLAQLADDPYPISNPQEKRIALTQLLKEKVSLIVVDNLETAIDYQAILPLLRHLANPSKFLITSRLSLASQGDIYCHSLSELSADDALAFLRYEAQSRGMDRVATATDEQLHILYAIVGGNPLALKLILGQIQFLPLDQILTSLRHAETSRVEQLYDYIYWQAWQILHEDSRRLLLTMTVVPNATFAQLQVASELTIDTLQDALTQLRSCSLVEVGGDLNKPRYRLHRLTETFLLHKVIRWQKPIALETSTDATFFLQRVVGMVERWEADDAVQSVEIEILDQEHEAILKAISFGLAIPQAWLVIKRLIIALTSYMERRGHWVVWHTILERAIEVAQQEMDIEGEMTLLALLARLCQRENRLAEVIQYYRQVIRLARRTENRFEEARACSNLSYAYINGGCWWRAEVLSCHALVLFEAQESIHGQAHTHNHLGLLYTHQQRWAEAEDQLQQACTLWRKIEDQYNLMHGFGNLGLLYNEMDQPKQALIFLKQALKLAESTGENSHIGAFWNNMSIAYLQAGDLVQAEYYAKEAEALFRQSSSLSNLAETWQTLGRIYLHQDRPAEARKYLNRSTEGFQQLAYQTDTLAPFG